jgi:hypothetical protein
MMGTVKIAAVLILPLPWDVAHLKNRPETQGGERHPGQSKKALKVWFKTVSTFMDPGDIGFIRNEIQKKDITFVTLLKYLSSKTPTGVYLKSVEFGKQFPIDVPAAPGQGQQASSGSTPPPSPPAKTTEAKQDSGQKLSENEYPLILRGYIFAEADALELKLFDLVLSLNGSGFIRQVEVVSKENKQCGEDR